MQRRSIEESERTFYESIGGVQRCINSVYAIRKRRFNMTVYVVVVSLGLLGMFYFVLLR